MNYLALGDSISIDKYTGVPAGGASSQFARLIGATAFQNLTSDGNTTSGVLLDLQRVKGKPDVVTLTAGGNDFLQAGFAAFEMADQAAMERLVKLPMDNLKGICEKLATYQCAVIVNTIYDPTDGVDSLASAVGIPTSFRAAFEALNTGISELATENGFILSDLRRLFHGHGIVSPDPWFTQVIEPNYAGATAIARHWHNLLRLHSATRRV